jgi:large subunit ribosomal protein L22
MTLIKAQLNMLRISPRKVRLVVGLIRKKSVALALDQLAHMPKRTSGPLAKLVNSAVANAENNLKLSREHLWIKDLQVDEGVKLKRWLPKGFGRANPIHKKTSSIRLVLEDRSPKAPASSSTN